MPPFTTLLGESYYPNSFWFNVGGILIRTSDNYEEVEQKIEKIWREYSQTTYAALDTIRYKIDLAEGYSFKNPYDESEMISGEKMFDFLMKEYFLKNGTPISLFPSPSPLSPSPH